MGLELKFTFTKRLKTDRACPEGLINCKEAQGKWKQGQQFLKLFRINRVFFSLPERIGGLSVDLEGFEPSI